MIQLIVVYTILLSAIFLASQIFRRPAIATTLVWGMITMETILQQRIEFLHFLRHRLPEIVLF